jgi:hypothetical protein
MSFDSLRNTLLYMEAERKREQEIAEKLEAQRLEDEEARRRRSEELEKPLEAPPGLLSRGGRDMSHTNDADKPSSRKTVSAEASCTADLSQAETAGARALKFGERKADEPERPKTERKPYTKKAAMTALKPYVRDDVNLESLFGNAARNGMSECKANSRGWEMIKLFAFMASTGRLKDEYADKKAENLFFRE